LLSQAQLLQPKTETFTHADTLRGSLNPNRTWWEVKRYEVEVTPDYDAKSITGKTTISFYDSGVGYQMQVDLQQPLVVDSVVAVGDGNYPDKKLPFTRYQGDNYLLVQYRNPAIKYKLIPGMRKLQVYYHGVPREAKRAPWDGGWIWTKDADGRPWMSVACQGLGASVWYPCKDYQGDEPDSGASLTVVVPDTLVAVGNGRLVNQTKAGGMATYTWQVKNPINNYLLIPSIGKYVHFGETFNGEKGPLTCDYWVLDYNLEKAKQQFKEAPRMLKAFEYWYGPYPFYEDGYKLVDAPHLGMEHQSAVAYGNKYQNGYLGRDLSGTGEGLKFDFIIVHESGHEWFANNITTKDIADMWVHEGFTNYSETLFLDYWFGNAAGDRYVQGLQRNLRNDKPVIGPYGVNTEGSGDMYNKGSCMLHTIRHIINNDSLFRNILRGLNKTFYHQTVDTKEVEDYVSRQAGFDYGNVFTQYLRTIQIPRLEFNVNPDKGTISYRYTNCTKGFNLPIVLKGEAAAIRLQPTETWATTSITKAQLPLLTEEAIKKMYYIETAIVANH
jgi:aminopeptidase N